MRLQEALNKLKSLNCQVAVLDELLAHLEKALDGSLEIPVDADPGVADAQSIVEVQTWLAIKRDRLLELLEAVGDLEVANADGLDVDGDD